MPDPFERTGRAGKWDWDNSQPARSQARAAAAQEHLVPEVNKEGKRPPGKKDPNLCKGQHWKGPHTPGIELQNNGWLAGRKKECGWAVYWRMHERKPYWSCRHVLICSGCGKDFGACLPAQCPLYHPVTSKEQAWIDAEIARREQQEASWVRRRKPIITGPQGYRKKKK